MFAKTVKIYLKLQSILQKILWKQRLHFGRTTKKISRNFEKFSAWGPKKSGISVFIEAFFPQKNLLDTRNADFKTIQLFFAKSQKIPGSSSETANIYSSQKIIISSKNTFGGINYIFDSRLLKLFAKVQRTLHTKSENI